MPEKKGERSISDKRDEEGRIRFGKTNYLLLSLGILFIILGYLTLSKGSITLAPILLVVGYCILIPIGIVIKGRKKTQ